MLDLDEQAIVHCDAEWVLRDENGEVVQVERVENLTVSAGKVLWLAASAAAQINSFCYMAIGTSASAPTVGDTALGAEVARSTQITPTYAAPGGIPTLTFTFTFGAGVGTGTIQEAGLFNASSGPTMYNHMLTGSISKLAGYSLTGTINLS